MSTLTSKTMAERIAERVVLEVCELPDYNSPEGQPDLVMCTVQELNACVLRAFEQLEYDREMERGPTAHETLAVDPDAERFRWLQEAVDRNHRFSVYEHGTKVFELRTAIDIVRGMTAARDGK